jgi:single-strand DNA-binding protein
MNSIQLIGRLTAKPELRFTPTGTATTTIRLAVPRRRRKGEADPAPVYINVVTYGAQAEGWPSTWTRAGGCRSSDASTTGVDHRRRPPLPP